MHGLPLRIYPLPLCLASSVLDLYPQPLRLASSVLDLYPPSLPLSLFTVKSG